MTTPIGSKSRLLSLSRQAFPWSKLVHVKTSSHIHTHTRTHTYTRTHTHKHAHAHIYTLMCTHFYMHTHINTYVPAAVRQILAFTRGACTALQTSILRSCSSSSNSSNMAALAGAILPLSITVAWTSMPMSVRARMNGKQVQKRRTATPLEEVGPFVVLTFNL